MPVGHELDFPAVEDRLGLWPLGTTFFTASLPTTIGATAAGGPAAAIATGWTAIGFSTAILPFASRSTGAIFASVLGRQLCKPLARVGFFRPGGGETQG
ncbi:MAG TPA: hypothetical protein VNB29_11100 [Chthoniobacterales bacterium]|nr:hypothetical protein [Chthoniobacterales bacterium]